MAQFSAIAVFGISWGINSWVQIERNYGLVSLPLKDYNLRASLPKCQYGWVC